MDRVGRATFANFSVNKCPGSRAWYLLKRAWPLSLAVPGDVLEDQRRIMLEMRDIKIMPYSLFYNHFHEISEHETRIVTVIDQSVFNLPPADYSFLEMFCDEPGCDCRRVFFSVLSSLQNDIQAVITWGWEKREFYAKWMGDDDPIIIRDLIGPALNLVSPQTKFASALLDLFRNVLLKDAAYVDRIKRHYAMFRQKIDNQANSACLRKKKRRKA